MLNSGYAGLTVAYAFVGLLLLGIILYARWRWPVKVAAAVITVAFCLVSYVSIPGLLGWPTAQDLPQKFLLHAAYVQQPDKLSKSKGTIDLWVTDAQDLARGEVPRAYQIPYSPPLHEVVINATAKMSKGVPQMGEFRNPHTSAIAGLHDPAAAGQLSVPLTFFDIPDPMFPDK
jgi:hypothetical protein